MGRAKGETPKTNAMRELEAAGVAYELHTYEIEDETTVGIGLRVAEVTGVPLEAAFKTLACVSPRGGHAVFCIPVANELDLKKAARAAGEKSLSLVNWRDLRTLTGYVRGGCSPIGMKKHFPTFFDETAQLFDTIAVSGGAIGVQLVVSPDELCAFCSAAYADVVED